MKADDEQIDPRWPPLRRWSAEQLDLPGDSTPEAVRAKALTQLSEWDFVPPDNWQQASELLLMPSGSSEASPAISTWGREQALAEIEGALRTEVEEFAHGFFELPGAPRKDRFAELRKRCEGFPLLVARLDRLAPGLEMNPRQATNDDPRVTTLSREAAELFVLAPQPQAIRRRSLLLEKQDDMPPWSAAARWLLEQHPGEATLDDGYLFALAGWQAAQARLKKARRKQQKLQKQVVKQLNRTSWQFSGAGVPAGVLIAIFVIGRLVMVAGWSSSRQQRPGYSPYSDETLRVMRELEEARRKTALPGTETPKFPPYVDIRGLTDSEANAALRRAREAQSSKMPSYRYVHRSAEIAILEPLSADLSERPGDDLDETTKEMIGAVLAIGGGTPPTADALSRLGLLQQTKMLVIVIDQRLLSGRIDLRKSWFVMVNVGVMSAEEPKWNDILAQMEQNVQPALRASARLVLEQGRRSFRQNKTLAQGLSPAAIIPIGPFSIESAASPLPQREDLLDAAEAPP